MTFPSAVSSTVVPATASRRDRVAAVRTSGPLTGSRWPKLPNPKGLRRRPEVEAPPAPNMPMRSSRSGWPAPEVEKRTPPPPPPNILDRMSSKPAPEAPEEPEVKRAPPLAMERMASYC